MFRSCVLWVAILVALMFDRYNLVTTGWNSIRRNRALLFALQISAGITRGEPNAKSFLDLPNFPTL
jgi:hypothetical protein